MKTVWVYEANELDDWNLQTRLKVFATEEAARTFWKTQKQYLLDTTDTEYFNVDDDGDSIFIYNENEGGDEFWYGIKEYPVEE